jgi:hypothetical protein
MVINLAVQKRLPEIDEMEENTTQSSSCGPPPAAKCPPTKPATWAEKGKAIIG